VELKSENKVWFAQALRGIAALSVVIYHLCGKFWMSNDAISSIMFLKPAKNISLFYIPFLNFLESKNLDMGSFGVGLFFLISGFVIPISIEKLNVKEFLTRRIFRIYPTYVIGLLISCIFLFLYALINKQSYPISFSHFAINASLLRDWFNIVSIDYSNWTLEIEIKFYIFAILLAVLFKLRNAKALIGCTLLMTLSNLLYAGYYQYLVLHALRFRLAYLISFNSVFLMFMLMGVCIYNLFKNYWSLKKFIVIIGIIYIEFFVSVLFGPCSTSKWIYIIPYTLAIITFLTCYFVRNKLKYNKFIDSVSNISYPMYVVHAVSGYVTLSIMFSITQNAYVSILVAAVVFVTLAVLLHKFVELPTNRFGKNLFKHNAKITSVKQAKPISKGSIS